LSSIRLLHRIAIHLHLSFALSEHNDERTHLGGGVTALYLPRTAHHAWLWGFPGNGCSQLLLRRDQLHDPRCFSPHERCPAQSESDLQLVRTLACAHHWLEQLLSGQVSSLRAIAKSEGKSERYVGRVIRAAFLAPDLLELVLEGRQPASLTLGALTKDLPFDWRERCCFGVAVGPGEVSVSGCRLV